MGAAVSLSRRNLFMLHLKLNFLVHRANLEMVPDQVSFSPCGTYLATLRRVSEPVISLLPF